MKRIYTRSTTEPLRAPVVPRPLEPPPLQRKPPEPKSRLWLIVGIVILAIIVIALVRSTLRNRQNASSVMAAGQTVAVERAEFVKSIRLTGTMEAVESYSVAAPRIQGAGGNLMLTVLDTAGTRVKKGDIVAQFDPQVEIQNFLTAKSDYQGLEDQIAAKKADEAAAKAKDDTDMTTAEDALKKAQLEMLKDPILSANEVKTNQLNLDEAKANLKQFKITYALKRQSAQAGIRDLEIQAKMKRLAMQQAQLNEKMMVARASADGIVVINSTWKGNGMGPFEVGDSVRPGQPYMRIVNPAQMQARIELNQLDYPFVHTGDPVAIHLDAYPGTSFSGVLESISPIANASDFSDKVRNLSALASVKGNDPRLMPDLSAAVDVQMEKLPRALLIPRSAVMTSGSKTFVLLKEGSGFSRREVKLGPLNDTEAVVESGLQAGDLIKRNPKG